MIRMRRILARNSEQFVVGDFVRRIGLHGVGIVESISDDDHALVAWGNDRRDVLPFTMLRGVRKGAER